MTKYKFTDILKALDYVKSLHFRRQSSCMLHLSYFPPPGSITFVVQGADLLFDSPSHSLALEQKVEAARVSLGHFLCLLFPGPSSSPPCAGGGRRG